MAAFVVDHDELTRLVTGEVVVPGYPDYDVLRKPAMARFDHVRPAVIVRCQTPADVSEVIRFARRAGLPLAIRCGGHSVAGRSSTEGIVIDVTPMRHVAVSDGIATVGAGVRLGELYEALYEHGVTLPAGCGPSVGIAGLTLGGGIGILGRRYGLTCDRLHRAEVVLADGQLIECDERQEPDLFWALRGAGGGNFGVVTSLVFETVPAADATVFQLVWSPEHTDALVEAWQAWAPSAPDNVDATLRLVAGTHAGPARVELIGAVIGSEADTAAHVDAFGSITRVTPASAWFREMTYPAAKRQLDNLDQHAESFDAESNRRGHIYAKSEFFRRPLDHQTITALGQNMMQDVTGGRAREVAFMPWGGAYNGVAPDATGFPHRNELFLVQHLLETDPGAPETQHEAGLSWLARSWALLHPFGSGGVYPNFPDPDLRDWGPAYYGQNYARLLHVKATYDPDNLFRFHQSLPLTH
jgi:FAD/FMN-containing dehydrogenase